MSRIGVIAALIALPALVSCSGSSQPESVTLPGFTIELPAGKVTRTSENSLGGVHSLELPAPAFRDLVSGGEFWDREMEVHWSQNAMSYEAWSSAYLPAVVAQLPGESQASKVVREELLSESSWLTMVQNDKELVGIGAVMCSQTLAVLITYVRFKDLDRQAQAMREIVQSVRCAPGAATPARLTIATRLPASLGRTADTAAQIYRSLDGERFAINYAVKDLRSSPAALRSLMETVVSMRFQIAPPEAEYADIKLPAELLLRKAALTRLRPKSGGAPIYVGTIYCEQQEVTIVGYWESPLPGDRLAVERLSQVGCPGEGSTPSPTFDSLVDAACVSGNQDACALKAPAAN